MGWLWFISLRFLQPELQHRAVHIAGQRVQLVGGLAGAGDGLMGVLALAGDMLDFVAHILAGLRLLLHGVGDVLERFHRIQ